MKATPHWIVTGLSGRDSVAYSRDGLVPMRRAYRYRILADALTVLDWCKARYPACTDWQIQRAC